MDRVVNATSCLDTYALIELFRGNEHYRDLKTQTVLIPDPVLVEFWDVVARSHGTAEADRWYALFELDAVPVPHDILREAMRLKRSRKELNLSVVDAAGYCLARHFGIPFVTGDEAFRSLPGVSFRKG